MLITPEEHEKINNIMKTVREMGDIYVTLRLKTLLEHLADGHIDATICNARGESLEQLNERYKELCDEEYDLQCDTSGHVAQGLQMALGMVQLEIAELEKQK